MLFLDFGEDNESCDTQVLKNAKEYASFPNTARAFISPLFNVKKLSVLKGTHDPSNLDQVMKKM